MALTQRLDATHASSDVDGGLRRSSNGNLERPNSFVRDSHALPLTSVLLGTLTFGDHKTGRHAELQRVINAATGVQTEDPALGSLQSKPLDSYDVEDLKRVRASLAENAQQARDRVRYFTEAVGKLDRAMQPRKRCRPESTSSARERSPARGAGQRPAGPPAHVTKGSSGAISSSLDTTTASQKGGDKAKSGIVKKRVRTSLVDVRPERPPVNLSVQRSSSLQDREQDASKKSSSSLTSLADEKERMPLGSSDGWEKTKMKGRRTATIKAETSSVVTVAAKGSADGDREHKGNAQHQRHSVESRSRSSEGHGFSSGPVNGVITIMQKAESPVQANGSAPRGSKGESDGAPHAGDKGDRPTFAERERLTSKSGVKSSPREEAHPASPVVTTKAKGARGPRSNSVAGAAQSVHLSRASSFTEAREKPSATVSPKPQVPSGTTNRKRPAPSRSPSPPSWGSARQKMARVSRRVNLKTPLGILTPPKGEQNGAAAAEGGVPGRDGPGPAASSPGARATPPPMSVGPNLARRVRAASSTHTLAQTKPRNERSSISTGPLESEDSGDDSHKPKDRVKKQEGVPVEKKVLSSREKMANVVLTAKKVRVTGVEEETGGGDGVRRQGRTGRGSVAPRTPAVASPPPEEAESLPVNAKLTRSARATVETKPVGPGRPVTKKGAGDRKVTSRPRRLLGNNGPGELSGEEDDDHEHLVKAVRQAMEFSAAACPNSFWRQVEPYFAYVTSDDLSFLHEQMDMAQGNITPSPSLQPDKGAFSAKDFNDLREPHGIGRAIRRGVGGAWLDKIFPLSQRLLSAFINEGEEADRDADSSILSSKLDHDRRDPECESDCDDVRSESEPRRSGARGGSWSEHSPTRNGHAGRLWGEDNQEGVDILRDTEGEQAGRQGCVSGGQVYSKEDPCPLSSWEARYQRMGLDDRLLLELQSIGLLPAQPLERSELEADEISEELRRLEHQHNKQVCINKENLSRLRNAVLAKKEDEARAQERLAIDKLLETAFKKRLGGRTSIGAAAKGARAAALTLARRVLARARSFDVGHTCITDPALRDLLLYVAAPKVPQPAPGAAADANNKAGATTAGVADCMTTNLSLASELPSVGANLVGGTPTAPATEGKSTSERDPFGGAHPLSAAWLLRTKEAELCLDDVAGPTSLPPSLNGLGGVKGKRSERDREGKVGAHTRALDAAKGERKTKTKPRQKSGGPPLKSVKRLALDPPLPPAPNDPEGHLDLSGLHLPSMEEEGDMGAATAIGPHHDLGWLDLSWDDPLPNSGEFLSGLDVPMDDLAGLDMMM